MIKFISRLVFYNLLVMVAGTVLIVIIGINIELVIQIVLVYLAIEMGKEGLSNIVKTVDTHESTKNQKEDRA